LNETLGGGFIPKFTEAITMIVSTGSKTLDNLLGGGIRSGLVTDFFGMSGTGKSQLCFSLCVNCVREVFPGQTIIFIDTTGNFRPERIKEIASYKGRNDILKKISYLRVFNSSDQFNAVNRVHKMNAKMIIVDNISSLISDEFTGLQMHFVLMKHMHTLCQTAISLDCAVVVTNMLRYSKRNGSFIEREFMATSISLYTHVRVKLETADSDKPQFRASLLQPSTSKRGYFRIDKEGVTDL
jgi:RecA/RadA recombinase